MFSGKTGKALLKVDGLGDRDSYITPSRHVGRSRVLVKYRLEVGAEGDVFRRRGWRLQGCYEVVSDGYAYLVYLKLVRGPGVALGG